MPNRRTLLLAPLRYAPRDHRTRTIGRPPGAYNSSPGRGSRLFGEVHSVAARESVFTVRGSIATGRIGGRIQDRDQVERQGE